MLLVKNFKTVKSIVAIKQTEVTLQEDVDKTAALSEPWLLFYFPHINGTKKKWQVCSQSAYHHGTKTSSPNWAVSGSLSDHVFGFGKTFSLRMVLEETHCRFLFVSFFAPQVL